MYKPHSILLIIFLLHSLLNFSVAENIYLSINDANSSKQLINILQHEQQHTTRNLLSNIGDSNLANDYQLTILNYQSMLKWAGNKDNLANKLSTNVNNLEDHVQRVLGDGVYDLGAQIHGLNSCNISDRKPSNFTPIKIRYGNTSTTPQTYQLIGTKTGFLHMLKNHANSVEEVWAFMPNELFNIIPKLNSENLKYDDTYGIDGQGDVYIQDINSDGIVDESEGDKAWLYFGLGRAGASYYAIDISQPKKPKLMWHIDNKTQGFSQLAQTWSKVKIGFSTINKSVDGDKKPVVFFSAGYDETTDKGKGLYMVDAQSGKLLFSATSELTNQHNLQWQGISHSIPSSLATMDSDSDGYVDRIYTGDAGGKVWRIDMPSDNPFSDTLPWTIHQFADLNIQGALNQPVKISAEKPTIAFFSEPTITRAIMPYSRTTSVSNLGVAAEIQSNKLFDVIVLGSGNKASLLANKAINSIYMLKDSHILTQPFGRNTGTLMPKVITESDLYNVTKTTHKKRLSIPENEQLKLTTSRSKGWLIQYKNLSEQNMSAGLILFGVVYINSYRPLTSSLEDSNEPFFCLPSEGMARLYIVNLQDGSPVNYSGYIELGNFIPQQPNLIITEQTNEEVSNIEIDALNSTNVGFISNDADSLAQEVLIVCNADDCINENIQISTPQLSTDPLKDTVLSEIVNDISILKTIRTSLYIQDEK